MRELNKATINDIIRKCTTLVDLIDELRNKKAIPHSIGYLSGSTLCDILYEDFEEIILDDIEIPEPDIECMFNENLLSKIKNKHWLRDFLTENKYDLYQLFYVLDELNYKKEDYGI